MFAPVTEAGFQGAIGARSLRGAGIVLLLGFDVVAACIPPGAAVNATAGVTAFRLFAPVACIRAGTISACRQGITAAAAAAANIYSSGVSVLRC